MQVSHQRTRTASDVDLQLQSLLPPDQLAVPAGVAAPVQRASWCFPDFLAGHPLLFAAANWMTAPCPVLATYTASQLAPFGASRRPAAHRRLRASVSTSDGLLT